MRILRWLLPAFTLVLAGAVMLWEFDQKTSPGPLHPAHAARDELAGSQGCRRCHGAGDSGISAEACGACHAAVQAQLGSGRGLHGALPAAQARACADCHGEHHGARTRLLGEHAFARAGVPEVANYDHAHVPGFGLAGRHRTLACRECHRQADALVATAPRYLGLDQACAGCHDDPHRGTFGAGCADCHGQEAPFRDAPLFRHAELPLRDAHAAVACVACHAEGTRHAVAALRATPQAARTCMQCHQDPHRVAPGAAAPAALRLDDTADCARCHSATRWRDARMDAAAHAPAKFPLRGAHARVACASCHGDARQRGAFTAPAPALAACGACHSHPHRPEFVAEAVAAVGPARGCADCHRDGHARFADGALTAAQHAATGFPLAAPHAGLDCAKCHSGGSAAERFPGRSPADCRACHRDPHAGQFDGEARYAQCTACHAATHFAPHAFDLASHARTAFPLTGAHAAVGCTLCHRDTRAGVRTFHGTSQDCAHCHQDVHAGTFDRPGLPRTVAGRTGCARCHDTAAFAPVTVRSFDHAAWTGYALSGAHATLACARCHERRAAPGTDGRRLGAALGRACADCHVDPHVGQFAAGGRTDCARCHTPVDFADLRFDHQRDSAFPLDETHRRLACAKCHVAVDVAGRAVVRYKPLGARCADCHVVAGQKVRR